MKVSELIKILQDVDQEMPVAFSVNNHEYFSVADRRSHGGVKISLCHHYSGEYILIGNQAVKGLNEPNWYITEDIYGSTR